MADLVDRAFWRGRRVFLTGHTGFKGSWLALWLQSLGAEVSGYALAPDSTPNLYTLAAVGAGMQSRLADLRELAQLQAALQAARPEVLFHLAAQPLVGVGYADPLGTYGSNVTGTLHLLEAARHCSSLQVAVVITTDKVYANPETGRPFVESDPLGGSDPYSSSKACTELLCAAYRDAFLAPRQLRLATARAGNVFGGGDWAAQRLIPDLLAAFAAGRVAELRRPEAVRPWQHVLAPLHGYLLLAEKLWDSPEFARGWNFGPEAEDCLPVAAVASQLAALWGEAARWQALPSDFPHEAGQLRLDASQARSQLGWHPRWSLATCLAQTVSWQRAWLAGADLAALCQRQIAEYAHD